MLEVMIVVTAIALLATIATPAYARARKNARASRFISDIRVATGAFEMYYLESKAWPVERPAGQVPPEMVRYLGDFPWISRTPIGGRWDWDYRVRGIVAGVSVSGFTASVAELTDIDAKFDDGSLTTGAFRRTALSACSSVLE